jgi:signal transduction histidine kinase
MRFLRLSRQIAGKEEPAGSLDPPAEWVIAQGRLFLCALSLFAAFIDPRSPADFVSATNVLLIAYLAYSVGLVAATHWRLPDPASQVGIHSADVIVTSLLLLLTAGPTSPFVAFFIFILLAATLRWNWRGVVVTVAILLVVLAASSRAPGAVQPSGIRGLQTIVSAAYLAVMAGMLAYVATYRERSRQRLAKLAEWPAYETREKDLPAFASTLAHAASILGAPRVVAVWEEVEEPFVKVASWHQGRYHQSDERPGTFGDLVAPELTGSTFATANAASDLAVLPSGHARIKAQLVNLGLLSRFNITGMASAPFTGTICRGRVFVLDRSDWGEDQLLLTEIIAARLGVELDREVLQTRAEGAAAIRERMRLARDLHDGVLQSLTAAAFQLKLSSGRLDEESRLRLDSVRQLLANEQRRIREFVQETRQNKGLSGVVALNQDLRRVLTETSHTWNCALSFTVEPDDVMLSRQVAAQLSLMLSEAIANAVRHGEASQVKVAIRKDPDVLIIDVHDNGRGFSPDVLEDGQPAEIAGRAGPVSLRERVDDLGGSLEVLNAATGVELRIRVPMS